MEFSLEDPHHLRAHREQSIRPRAMEADATQPKAGVGNQQLIASTPDLGQQALLWESLSRDLQLFQAALNRAAREYLDERYPLGYTHLTWHDLQPVEQRRLIDCLGSEKLEPTRAKMKSRESGYSVAFENGALQERLNQSAKAYLRKYFKSDKNVQWLT
ncbi:hypothetical protein Slin15195_G118170 [Septoria linicola]|uniref:Uncharacterized protein n=1 Tax=Septoria linicola TaxID=215465 RepID=A0A9Q9B6T3_9PEZI|nr:hypothetical protein Slin14017_G095170 [Septoria linicola]USW58498.1 hypothetical protein Slin15195_G118170 [Septoria linicola]